MSPFRGGSFLKVTVPLTKGSLKLFHPRAYRAKALEGLQRLKEKYNGRLKELEGKI